MKKTVFGIFLAVILSLSNLIVSANNEEYNKISLDIDRNSKGYLDVLVYLNENIHLSGDIAIRDSEPENLGTDYVNELRRAANSNQERCIKLLKDNLETGKVKEYSPFFITNAIHVKADIDIINELSKLPEVSKIYKNDNVEMELSSISSLSTPSGETGWNHHEMKIDRVKHDLGIDGSGITIGFIDSGVDWTHPAIKNKWRGYNIETGEVNPEDSWLDLVGDSKLPTDEYSHGTAIVSIAVAGSGENSPLVGVAPGAKWIAARAFADKNTTNVNIIKAAEWMLAPGGDPNKAPDIINNSWGGESSANPWFKDIVVAWKSVGILPVFAAGNSVDSVAKPGSIENPASLLNTLSVGAIDDDLKLAKFSKRGPSAFDSSEKIIKPELVAPGNNIRAAIINNGYAKMYGTSIATPHISGLAALMKQHNPNASPMKIEKAMIASAEPLTDGEYPESPNMGYGYGLPDAYKAVNLIKENDSYIRISGKNRFETAIELSKKYYPEGANTVFITAGHAYTDALVMSPLSNKYDGPVLLSEKDNLSEEVLSEIKRLSPDNIFIIGGENTIGQRVIDILSEEMSINAERIYGKNRYITSVNIADKVYEHNKFSEVFIVNGYKEIDAISISGIAKQKNTPVILTDGKSLDSDIKSALMKYGVSNAVIIGGESTIETGLADELKSMDISTERIGGSDRFQTSLLINQKYIGTSKNPFIANGINAVDALTAGPIAGKIKSPMILIKKDEIPEGVREYMNGLGAGKITILGGINSIMDETVFELINW